VEFQETVDLVVVPVDIIMMGAQGLEVLVHLVKVMLAEQWVLRIIVAVVAVLVALV
jgi:hypothetical protein